MSESGEQTEYAERRLASMNDTHPATVSRRFRIFALDPLVTNRVRRTGRDTFGDPVEVRQDNDPHQCRVCLELTEPNEPYLLFSHSPFQGLTPYSERGPLFIHQRDCLHYQDTSSLPPEFPRDIVLRGYDSADAIVAAELSDGDDLEALVERLLGFSRVSYIHARNRTYGCYMYRIEPDQRCDS